MHRENVFAGSPKTSAVGGKALTTGSIYQYFSPPVLHTLILTLLFCLAAVCQTAAAEGEGMVIASETPGFEGNTVSATNESKSPTASDTDEIIPEFDPADLWKTFGAAGSQNRRKRQNYAARCAYWRYSRSPCCVTAR